MELLRRAWFVMRNQGLRALLRKLRSRLSGSPAEDAEPLQIRMLVRTADAASVDWTVSPAWAGRSVVVRDRPIRTAWIMHPPGESSGGHQNIFRFIDYLERAGHKATVYLYHSADHQIDARYLQRLIHDSASYPAVEAEFRVYDHVAPDTDAIFATGWETAYPAYRDPSMAKRFYFVQDYEPSFYPVGTEHVFAENTYRFGFHGVTAGPWLAHKLSTEYGMRTESFDFAADLGNYTYSNRQRRSDVFFYARPVTARRGFELGALALEEFARQRPDVTLHFAGWDVSRYDLGFDYVNHGAMRVGDLDALYNRCAAALVLSLTNLSLLPLELLASGVIPVVNAGENNSMVTTNPFLRYCEPTPKALARALIEVLERPDQSGYAERASQSVAGLSWETSGRQFVDIVSGVLRG